MGVNRQKIISIAEAEAEAASCGLIKFFSFTGV